MGSGLIGAARALRVAKIKARAIAASEPAGAETAMTLDPFWNQVSVVVKVAGTGLPPTTYIPPVFPVTNEAAPAMGPVRLSLVQGNNDSIQVPTGAVGVLLLPDPASTTPKTVCNNSAASFAGVMFTGQPVYFPIVSGQGCYIYANAAEDIMIHWL